MLVCLCIIKMFFSSCFILGFVCFKTVLFCICFAYLKSNCLSYFYNSKPIFMLIRLMLVCLSVCCKTIFPLTHLLGLYVCLFVYQTTPFLWVFLYPKSFLICVCLLLTFFSPSLNTILSLNKI